MHQYATLADTVYFGFASNLTSGAAGDGASPTFAVRLCGASASAAPVLTGTPTLLTHASYVDGSYEIAVAATAANGFAAGSTYLVFGGLTISGVIPNSCVGSFTLGLVPADAVKLGGTAQTGRDVGASVLVGDKTGFSLSAAGITAIWAETMAGTVTAVKAMRGFIAALLGKASGLSVNTPQYRDVADTKNVISATTDAHGNRSAVTLDLS